MYQCDEPSTVPVSMAARCVLLSPRGLTLGSSTSTHSFAGSAALMKRSRSILRYIRCQYWCLLLLCVHCRPTLAPDGSGLGIYACSLIIYASPSFSSSFLTLLPPFPPSFHPSISLSFPPSHPPCFPLLFYLSFSPPPTPRSSSLPHLVPTFFVDYSAPSLHLYGGGSLEALESPPLGPQPVTEIHFHCIEFEEITPWLSKLAHSYHNLTVRRISGALLS